MESETTEAIPLSILYLQIEYGDIPSAVLGIGSNASELEIRDAYRAVALKIHPDKAPSDSVREVHTLLFQKVQVAYDSLLATQDGGPGQYRPPKQLPETCLHCTPAMLLFEKRYEVRARKLYKRNLPPIF
jgi:hypothetical protein